MTAAVTSGVSTDTGSPSGPCVYITDLSTPLPGPGTVRDLIIRLGLDVESRHQPNTGTTMLIGYGGTALRCRWGMDVVAELAAALAASDTIQSIGDVATTPPSQSFALAIEIVTTAHDGAPNAQGIALSAVQHLCCATAMLGAALGAGRMFWPPAGLWSSTSELGSAIAAMEAEGLPPVLHLVAFRHQDGVDDRSLLQSCGLSLFVGAEIILDYPSSFGGAEAVRRLARLAIHAMISGAPTPMTQMPGILRDELLSVGDWSTGCLPGQGVHHIPIRLTYGSR